MGRQSSRRDFLKESALAGVGFWVAGTSLGAPVKSANEKVNIACIGVGGKGDSDSEQAGRVGNVVAICDIDEKFLNAKAAKYPGAKKYFDFRKMLTEMDKDIDAVTVSTADHTHAAASIMAMKMKKHVYCQKPLTHTVYEARLMREVANKMGVATQMGNQGTAATGLRRAVEFVQDGGIGKVTEAHVWTNRPVWPQSPNVKARPAKEDPVPPTIHWDEWIGPAPFRPYVGNRTYHDFNWRGWWDFGTGALGDMACHTANMAFMALKLGWPTSIAAENEALNPETYPGWARVVYEFPARDGMGPVKFVWYEGKKDGKYVLPEPESVKGQAERPSGLAVYYKDNKWFFRNAEGKVKHVSSGSFLVGDKACLFSPDDYGADAYLVTADGNVERLTGEPKRLPINGKDDGGMKMEWVEAIRSNNPKIAISNFNYAGMLTEAILLGNVAMRAGKKITYDGAHMKIPDYPDAEKYLKTEYRKGWEDCIKV